MKLEILNEDPLNILSTTKSIVENSQHVFLIENKIDDYIINKIINKFSKGLDNEYELGRDLAGKIEDNLELIFVENSMNFCFWPTKDQPKWEVEWPMGGKVYGGWYGLVSCFKRAMAEGVPILDPNYLSNISQEEARKIFRGVNDVEIPLLTERINNLREVGKVLNEKFEGKIMKLLETSDYDAVKIVNNISENFPCFRDISYLDNKKVIFLKRAQICPNDFSYIIKDRITNLDKLTAYADYKLPQLLRMFGVISYSESLSAKVDAMTEIPHDSREEVEIRAVTVWAVELLRQRIGKLTAGQIDNTIWLMSQDIQGESKPYHRSRTIFY